MLHLQEQDINWSELINKPNKWTLNGMQGYYAVSEWYLLKSNFDIETTQNGKLLYIKDGEVLKKEILNQMKQEDILRNLEQIKNLTWRGEYNQQNKKIGYWKAFWQGKDINIGGQYDWNGIKIGKWVELFYNYWDQCDMILEGEYYNGIKIGFWQTSYCGKVIALGMYNFEGLKNGFWVDIYQNFWEESQIQFQGKYNNDLKQGNWNILCKHKYQDSFEKIGGGLYDDNGVKQGKWKELYENYSKVTVGGEYQDGKKVDKWIIYFGQEHSYNYHEGGGLYNQTGEKIGIWIEPYDGAFQNLDVVQKGEYRNSKRVGKWQYFEEDRIIGGGLYDENGAKIDKWIDLHQNYHHLSQTTFVGCYKQGLKSGKWEIMFKNEKIHIKKEITIGGGTYNENGHKNGKWIDVDITFTKFQSLTYEGEYKEGMKVGNWNYVLDRQNKNKLHIIGGGLYNKNGKKQGKWVNFHIKFEKNFQIIEQGQYQNGIRTGKWECKYRFQTKEELKYAGGGNYDCYGKKFGKWIDIDYQFQLGYYKVHIGKYIAGHQYGSYIEEMLP